jgi:hypothetical protein
MSNQCQQACGVCESNKTVQWKEDGDEPLLRTGVVIFAGIIGILIVVIVATVVGCRKGIYAAMEKATTDTKLAAAKEDYVSVQIVEEEDTQQSKADGKQHHQKGLGILIKTPDDRKRHSTARMEENEVYLGAEKSPTNLRFWSEVKVVDFSGKIGGSSSLGNGMTTQLIYNEQKVRAVVTAPFSPLSWSSVQNTELVAVRGHFDVMETDVKEKIALCAFVDEGADRAIAPKLAVTMCDAGAVAVIVVAPYAVANSLLFPMTFDSPLIRFNTSLCNEITKPAFQSCYESVWLGEQDGLACKSCSCPMALPMNKWSFAKGGIPCTLARYKPNNAGNTPSLKQPGTAIVILIGTWPDKAVNDYSMSTMQAKELANQVLSEQLKPACIIFIATEGLTEADLKWTLPSTTTQVPLIFIQADATDRTKRCAADADNDGGAEDVGTEPQSENRVTSVADGNEEYLEVDSVLGATRATTADSELFAKQSLVKTLVISADNNVQPTVQVFGNASEVTIPVLLVDSRLQGKEKQLEDMIASQNPWKLTVTKQQQHPQYVPVGDESTQQDDNSTNGDEVTGEETSSSNGSFTKAEEFNEGGVSAKDGQSDADDDEEDDDNNDAEKAVFEILAFDHEKFKLESFSGMPIVFEGALSSEVVETEPQPSLSTTILALNVSRGKQQQTLDQTLTALARRRPAAILIAVERKDTKTAIERADMWLNLSPRIPLIYTSPGSLKELERFMLTDPACTSDPQTEYTASPVGSEGTLDNAEGTRVLNTIGVVFSPDPDRAPRADVKGAPTFYTRDGMVIPAERLAPIDEVVFRTRAGIDVATIPTGIGPTKWNLANVNPHTGKAWTGLIACGERPVEFTLPGLPPKGGFLLPFSQPKGATPTVEGAQLCFIDLEVVGSGNDLEMGARVRGNMVIVTIPRNTSHHDVKTSFHKQCQVFYSDGAVAVVYVFKDQKGISTLGYKGIYGNSNGAKRRRLATVSIPCAYALYDDQSVETGLLWRTIFRDKKVLPVMTVRTDQRKGSCCLIDPATIKGADLMGVVDRIMEIQTVGKGAAVVIPFHESNTESNKVLGDLRPRSEEWNTILGNVSKKIRIPVILVPDQKSPGSAHSAFFTKYGAWYHKGDPDVLVDNKCEISEFRGDLPSISSSRRTEERSETILLVVWGVLTFACFCLISYGIIGNLYILKTFPLWRRLEDMSANYANEVWVVDPGSVCGNHTNECEPPAPTCCDGCKGNECDDCVDHGFSFLGFKCCPQNASMLAFEQILLIGLTCASGLLAIINNLLQLYYMRQPPRNYWKTIGLYDQWLAKITPTLITNMLGGGQKSFRYLLKVKLKREPKKAVVSKFDKRGDMLKEAETYNENQFELSQLGPKEEPSGRFKVFRDDSVVYYILDPFILKFGSYAAPDAIKPNHDDHYFCHATLADIDQIAAHHGVTKDATKVLFQELSQRPQTSWVFELMQKVSLLLSVGLLVFAQGFTNATPVVECYSCGEDRERFHQQLAAQTAGIGGLQIALFGSVSNSFGSRAITEAIVDAPPEGNSAGDDVLSATPEVTMNFQGQGRDIAMDDGISTDSDDNISSDSAGASSNAASGAEHGISGAENSLAIHFRACNAQFGPRKFDAITFERNIVCVCMSQSSIPERKPFGDVDVKGNVVLCEFTDKRSKSIDDLAVYYYTIACLLTKQNASAVIFVQPPLLSNPTDATTCGLPLVFASSELLRRIVNSRRNAVAIPTLMISVDDGNQLKKAINANVFGFSVSITDEQQAVAISKLGRDVAELSLDFLPEERITVPRAPEPPDVPRAATPESMRVEGKKRKFSHDWTIEFSCATEGATINYMVYYEPLDGSGILSPPIKDYRIAGTIENGKLLAPALVDFRIAGKVAILFYSSKQMLAASEVVRCSWDIWVTCQPKVNVRLTKSKSLFHEMSQEVVITRTIARESPFAHGVGFIEQREQKEGVLYVFEQFKANDVFNDSENALYVMYKCATGPIGFASVLTLLDQFRRLDSYDENTATEQEASTLVGRQRARSPLTVSSRRVGFAETVICFMTLEKALVLSLKTFDMSGGDLAGFIFSTTSVEIKMAMEKVLLDQEEAAVLESCGLGSSGAPMATTNYGGRSPGAAKLLLKTKLCHALHFPTIAAQTTSELSAPQTRRSVAARCFYTVDVDLASEQTPTLPSIPTDFLQENVGKTSAPLWGATQSAKDKPTLLLAKQRQNTTFSYQDHAGGIPTFSAFENAKYTITAVSVADGMAPSSPISKTFVIDRNAVIRKVSQKKKGGASTGKAKVDVHFADADVGADSNGSSSSEGNFGFGIDFDGGVGDELVVSRQPKTALRKRRASQKKNVKVTTGQKGNATADKAEVEAVADNGSFETATRGMDKQYSAKWASQDPTAVAKRDAEESARMKAMYVGKDYETRPRHNHEIRAIRAARAANPLFHRDDEVLLVHQMKGRMYALEKQRREVEHGLDKSNVQRKALESLAAQKADRAKQEMARLQRRAERRAELRAEQVELEKEAFLNGLIFSPVLQNVNAQSTSPTPSTRLTAAGTALQGNTRSLLTTTEQDKEVVAEFKENADEAK